MAPVRFGFSQSQGRQAARVIIELGGVRPWPQDLELVSQTLDEQYVGAPLLPSKEGHGYRNMSQKIWRTNCLIRKCTGQPLGLFPFRFQQSPALFCCLNLCAERRLP